MNLEIKFVEHTNKTVVHLFGEIDIYTATQLKEALLPLSQDAGHVLIVNLENVDYMDSTGLGVFISVLKAAKEHESTFKLINLKERVLRLFTITGLNEIMDISPLNGGVKVGKNDGTV